MYKSLRKVTYMVISRNKFNQILDREYVDVPYSLSDIEMEYAACKLAAEKYQLSGNLIATKVA